MKAFQRKKVFCYWTILCLVFVSNGSLSNSIANPNATDSTMSTQIELESHPWLKALLNKEPTAPQVNMELEGIQYPPPTPVQTPAEFDPCQGVIIYWENVYGDELDRVFLPMVQQIDRENTIYIAVRYEYKLNNIVNLLIDEGCSFENLSFFIYPCNLFWMRDFAPFFVYDSDDRLVGIDTKYVDFYPLSDGFPDFFCQNYCFDLYDFDFYFDGGNFMTDGKGLFAASDVIFFQNPDLTPEEADSLMATYFGCERLIIFEMCNQYIQFGHIDMWAKFLNTNTVLVAQVPYPHTIEYALLENAASIFDTLKTYNGETFNVLRVPLVRMTSIQWYATYTNSLILDDQVLLPIYNRSSDSLAIATYQAALPDHEIIPIDCGDFSSRWASAIHCLTREIPESIHPPEVAVHAGPPSGGSIGDVCPSTFTIKNPEARPYTYDVTTINSAGWMLDPDAFELTLEACTDTVIEIMCTIPDTAMEGTSITIMLTATSQSDLLVTGTASLTLTVCRDKKGDANHDCVLDILDALFVINTILELQEPEPDEIMRIDCNGPSGNCDGDGVVNILDAVKIVNLIVGLDSCP